jgi:hypothetical protein
MRPWLGDVSLDPETQAVCFQMANESFKPGLFSFPAFICINDIHLPTATHPLWIAAYDTMTKNDRNWWVLLSFFSFNKTHTLSHWTG